MDLLHRKVIPLCQGIAPANLPSSRYRSLKKRLKQRPILMGRIAPTSVGTKKSQGRDEKLPTEGRVVSSLERKVSSVGKEAFQRWKKRFPPLEIIFPRKETFWKPYKKRSNALQAT